jgi:HK97 gp10 family phage protein
MKLDVKIEGAAEIRAVLAKLPPDLAKAVERNALRKGAALVRNEARAAAAQFRNPRPSRKTRRVKGGGSVAYDYGRLRRNIRLGQQKRAVKGMAPIQPGQAVVAVGIGSAFWGRFLEFGTRRMTKRPWLQPVADRALPQALRVIIASLRDDIDEVVAKQVRSSLRGAGRIARRIAG